MATASATRLITAEEFGQRPDPGYPEELVRGRIVAMTPPDRGHGYVCGQAYYILRQFIDERDPGRVMSNDSAIITERSPDTVRGADVCYYSYARLPRGVLAKGYGPEIPELVVEVRSPSDRWAAIHGKVGEYLDAGVLAVVVLDPDAEKAHVFRADDAPRIFGIEDELVLPGLLDGFSARVGRFFE
ncbi:MAG: Uma2 family endonuclease [Isosphaeraceae bacterium]